MPVNEEIRCPKVRLIDQEGKQIGVVTHAEAMAAARAANLDLVQVTEDDTPVCKLLDFGKFKYKQKRRTHQSKTKSHATHIKEIRLHPKTSPHDIDYRMKHAREFIGKGDRLLITIVFSGREMSHMDAGVEQLVKIAEQLQDIAKIEMQPKREGKRVSLMMAPK